MRDFARLLLIAVVMPAVVLAGLNLMQGAAAAREQLEVRLAAAAELTGRDIDSFIQAHSAALQVLAERRSAAGDLDHQAAWTADLRRTHRYYPDFNTMAVVDAQGRLVLTEPSAPTARGTLVADRSYFSEPRRTGRAHVSNAYRGRVVSDLPSMAVSAPLFDDGRFAGVIGGAIRIDAFPALRHQSLQTRGFEILLLDRDHTVVYASSGLPYRSLDVLQGSPRDRSLRTLESSSRRTRMQQLPAVLRDGGDAYGLMTPLEVGWRLIVLVPESAILAELRHNALVMFGLLVLVLVGVLIIAGAQMRRLGGYVRELLERMQRFVVDDTAAPAAPGSLPQELAPLAEALNQLAARARAAYGDVSLSLQEQQRLREELQAVARRLLTAQEDERNAISRELHDDIGQQITAIKLGATALQDEGDPALRSEILAEIITTADQTVAKLRNLSLLLRPPQLDSVGIEAALRWHAERLFRSGRPRMELQLNPLPDRPDPEVELACFRIAQEALTNVLRHADATRVKLTLAADAQGESLHLSIFDDGHGFDSGQVHGFGLVTMRERAQQLGGTLHIDTGVERGTCVRVTLPMHPAAQV